MAVHFVVIKIEDSTKFIRMFKIMKKLLLIPLLALFVSCGGSNDDCCLSGTQLTIVNNFDRWTINSIQLQGYNFQNLSISGSDS